MKFFGSSIFFLFQESEYRGLKPADEADNKKLQSRKEQVCSA